MNEMSIMELFGRYGPLASVKIMYPRSDDEKTRATNCGFVAYMSRKDAERAMHELSGTQLESIPIRMNWGRRKMNDFKRDEFSSFHRSFQLCIFLLNLFIFLPVFEN